MNKFLEKFQGKKLLFFLFLSTIFAFGAFIRFWNLDNNPPGLQYNEASSGLKAINAFENNTYQIFYNDNNGQEGLYTNILAICLKFLGINSFSLRFASAFLGTLTLIGFYFLLKELKFSRLSVLLGIFILSTSFWHLNFSHLVFSAIMIPFVLVWLLYFLFLGVRLEKNYFLILSGFLIGISFYIYTSLEIVLLILILSISFFLFYKTKFFKQYWLGISILISTIFLTIAPLIFYFYQNPTNLKFNLISNISNFPTLVEKGLIHINAFFFYGDPNQLYNHAGSPLIPPAWAVLLIIGFAFSIKDIALHLINRKNNNSWDPLFRISILAQIIFWTMLTPGILNTENLPNSLKIIGTIPAIIIFIILPFEYILRLRENLQKSTNFNLKPWRWKILNISLTGLITIIILTGFMEAYTYHFVWNKEAKTLEAFQNKLFDFGKLVKQIPLKNNNTLILPDSFKLENNSPSSILKTAEFSGYPEIKEFSIKHPVDALKKLENCQDNVYLFFEADQWLLDQFQKICPNFIAKKEKSTNGYYEFWTLKN